jgi:hypothetical protein
MPQDIHEAEAGHATPLKAVRRHCLSCCNGSANEVKLCQARSCALWRYRHGHRPTEEERATVADRQLYPLERGLAGATLPRTALKALRRRCLDCSGNSVGEVRSCKLTSCSLHPYRFSKNPNITRSEAWKLAAAERLRALPRVPALKLPIENHHSFGRARAEGGRGGDKAAFGRMTRAMGQTSK